MQTRSESPPRAIVPACRSGRTAAVLFVLLLLPQAQPARAQSPPVPHHPGHWTALQNWNKVAVHMALLPGGGGYHSKILFWHGSPASEANLDGGLWGWNWSASADQCGSFGSFTALPVSKAPYDIFCAGHTHAPQGNRLLLTGGTTVGEVGSRKSVYFDPTQSGTLAWTEVTNPMARRRWYPSAQLMPDGRTTTHSGSSYHHMWAFGGTTVPASAAQAQGDLHRLQLTEADDWDPMIPFRQAPDWPSKRFGHSMVRFSPVSPTILFGGLQSDGQYLQDSWVPQVNLLPMQDDGTYSWFKLNITSPNAPAPRMQHSAVMLSDDRTIVYGGRDGGQVFNDVWLSTSAGQDIQWELLSQEPVVPGGPLPGGRFGQAAIHQYNTDPSAPLRNRILVYGGATTIAGALADDDVWELTLDLTLYKARWRKLVVESGSPKPAARYQHAMVLDPAIRKREQDAACMWRMFVSGGRGVFGANTLSDELWQLWDVDENTVAWSQLDPGPSRRAGHSLVYDPGRHHLVLMGGDTGGSSSSDEVWEINVQCPASTYGATCENCEAPGFGPSWNNVTPSGSPALYGHTPLHYGYSIYARKPERFTAGTGGAGTWEVLNAPLGQEWYPFMFTIANGAHAGKVFNAGPSIDTYLFDPVAPSWTAFPTAGSGFRGGSAVLYRPDRVMKCGTRDTEEGATAVMTSKFIALDAAGPSWVVSADMDSGRANHNLTLLPTGEVLVTGGTEIANNAGWQGRSRGLVELWRPPDANYPNGVWYGGHGTNALEPSTAARDYHSVALLLPDGRVLCAGGNASPDQRKANIFCPPYLFTATGAPASRPTILSAPASITYGESFVIDKAAGDAIASACLVRPGAVTHAFDQDQRYIPLDFETLADNSGLRAVAPANGRVAPPGDYLLFIVNQSGVPAVARWVRLANCPVVPCDYLPPPAVNDPSVDIVGPTEIWLAWSAPGDDRDPALGAYDVRYSVSPITTEIAFAAATPVGSPYPPPTPGPLGSGQSCAKDGLASCTPYYFAIKTNDGAINWSSKATLSASTTCNGGGGGTSARRADERGEGACLVSNDSEFAVGGDAGGSSSLSAGAGGSRLAGTAGIAPVPGRLVAETRRTAAGGWAVTLRLVSQPEGFDAALAAGIVSQVAGEGGGWKTVGRHQPDSQGPLGLCALRDQGRVVFPAGYELDRVMKGLREGGRDLTLSLANHSRLGAMDGSVITAQVSVELILGDELTLDYALAGREVPGATGWYVLVRAGGRAQSLAPTRSRLDPPAPVRFTLYPNQPNPSRGATTIAFDLPVAGPVSLQIFDLLGRSVATLIRGEHPAGAHTVEWDLRDTDGGHVRPGVYVCRLVAGDFRAQTKIGVLP